ncbi:SIR2 family protein [Rubritalea spongiae]|uniref:SIR2 family protein n=1 Tax=Rubritalea spongiae TaxID=430797 RepID=A0ABW5DYN2_9BACT
MPAFVTNGPDIPERLLEAHEEGKVVFFCGAGISYPAGLPDFEGLVEKIYKLSGTNKSVVEKAALKKWRYDETLDLLERRLGDRERVRRALASSLEPRWGKDGAKDTHSALLKLACDAEGKTRLVTTNFDRIFEQVIKKEKLEVPSCPAPYLPIPKKSMWNGVVYLHGLLAKKEPSLEELNRLVVTSGDFGKAYLYERWAARFVSELLRNYTVCFVGYSIDDPVLRYMMDAISADALLGEQTPEAYAFAGYEGDSKDADAQWRTKGVTPVLYEVLPGKVGHSALHQTMIEWAKVYSTGAGGKSSIIANEASKLPTAITRDDFTVSRVLWAMTDSVAARTFAEHNPVPPFEWLKVFSEPLFGTDELSRYGVHEPSTKKTDNKFSMIDRPTPWKKAPYMSLTRQNHERSGWDDVMFQIGRWLLRHLNNPHLILWLAKKGGVLHGEFRNQIWRRIERISKAEKDGDEEALQKMLGGAPDAIPTPLMREAWMYLLLNYSEFQHYGWVYEWFSKLDMFGPTGGLRNELRERIFPKIIIEEAYSGREGDGSEEERIHSIFRYSVFAVGERVYSQFNSRKRHSERWGNDLHVFLNDFVAMVIEAEELHLKLYGEDGAKWYLSFEVPSISDSSQGKYTQNWQPLVRWARDAWSSLLQVDEVIARGYISQWSNSTAIMLKRLAMFAAAQEQILSSNERIEFLLSSAEVYLWDDAYRRELMRLLVVIGADVEPALKRSLEQEILNAPAEELIYEGETEEDLVRKRSYKIWLRLAKLREGGWELGENAAEYMDEYQAAHPDVGLSENQSEEFTSFMEMGEAELELSASCRTMGDDYVEWLIKNKEVDRFGRSEWSDLCRRKFKEPAKALNELIFEKEVWLPDRVNECIRAWSARETLLELSWNYAATFILRLSYEQREDIHRAVADALCKVGNLTAKRGERLRRQDDLVYKLGEDIVHRVYDEEPVSSDHAMAAINHPIGDVAEGIFLWWWNQSSSTDRKLEGNVRELFTQICSFEQPIYSYGILILSKYVEFLYRVDPGWTRDHVIVAFDWDNHEELAIAAWSGYLMSPRISPGLVADLKEHLIATSGRFNNEDTNAKQFADVVTYLGLTRYATFTNEDLRSIFESLSLYQLRFAAASISTRLKGVGEKRADYWRNTVKPFIRDIWPKDEEKKTEDVGGFFAEICVNAGDAFDEAWAEVKEWIKPMGWPDHLCDEIYESNLHKRHPGNVIALLDATIADDVHYIPSELSKIISEIPASNRRSAAFRRLSDLVERRG